MKTWTPPAEARLEAYLAERASREGLEGPDAAELKDDLRRHIYEEAESCPSEMIGLMHLETLLAQMDAGYPPAPEFIPGPEPAPSRRGSWIWLIAVFLPAAVLLLEVTTGCCASTLFDPIPTWWHTILIALVPVLNGWILLDCPHSRSERMKGAAAGISLVVATFYGLLFLPVIHFSLMGLIFLGFGLIPLTPPLAWFGSWRVGRRLKRESGSPSLVRQGWWIGAGAALLSLVVLEAPSAWTRTHLISAINHPQDNAAIDRLRNYHSERALLAACYERSDFNSGTDIAGWVATGWSFLDLTGERNLTVSNAEKTRDIFFRVTGKPFNSLKPPVNPNGQLARRGAAVEEVTFDNHLGGDQVAARLRHLDLKESRFDGHVDSQSRIGYGEWTMVFHNAAPNPLEARCLVRLPEGGRVSRLTLWVNGEPREAAFNTVSKVKAAYKEIAVVQRRDPVLVTMAGPDTVLVQCFPVPARGDMKIRFGITAPFRHDTWDLPRIVERNFGIGQKLEHAIWLQGDRDFHLNGGKPHASIHDGDGRSLSAALDSSEMTGTGANLRIDQLPEAKALWCEDPFAKVEERILIREPRRVTVPGSGKIIMVIDGSAGLAERKDQLASLIDENVIAILADDTARNIDSEGLRKYRFTGGRDNEPALIDAIRRSKEHGGIPVVWIHGPQSAEASKVERLTQLLERGTTRTVIHTLEGAPGPNRLTQALYRSSIQKRGPDLSDPSVVRKYLDGIRNGGETEGWTWRRSPAPDSQEGKAWDQLARLWAIDAAENPLFVMPEAERSATAARYQLVTSVSGAVVLETAEQFARHGLTPVDADAAPHIPSVPEPSTGLLVIITTAAALMRRKR